MIKIPKRYFISIVITGVIIFATNKFWLNIIPFDVNLSITNKSSFFVDVQLDKYSKLYFKDYKSDVHLIDFSNSPQNITFSIKRVKKVGGIRFLFSNLVLNIPITISSINLNNKINLNDFSNYKIDNGKILIKNDKLTIIPNKNICTLTYNRPLNIKGNINFDIYLLCIISILSFLLILKLTEYLADFKNLKKNSRIEIIFLLIFFILLYTPMSKINKENISVAENRTLAPFKPLLKENYQINYNFGKDFENYFNDRFNLRKALISLNILIKNIFSHRFVIVRHTGQTHFFDKKTNWIFYTIDDLSYKNINPLIVSNNLKTFNQFCNKNNIKTYILVVPEKNDIYSEFFLNYDRKLTQKNNDFIKQLHIDNIIYPYNEIKKASESDYTYFKTEHHWTNYGAYIGYKALIKKIKKDFPNINEVTLKEYNKFKNNKVRADFYQNYTIGTSLTPFGFPNVINSKILDTEYNFYDFKNDKNILKTTNYELMQRKYYYREMPDLKILLIGTSQSENLQKFLPYSVRNLYYIRLNTNRVQKNEHFKIMKRFKNDILKYKPDILVLCVTANNLYEMIDIFEESE